jgi:hypothetical protein
MSEVKVLVVIVQFSGFERLHRPRFIIEVETFNAADGAVFGADRIIL